MINIKEKNALVTGSSRGVGQQLAIGLAKLGCNVIVHGRTRESCSQTIELLEKYGVSTYSVFGELSDEVKVKGVIKQVMDLNIQVDILYNNAATMPPSHSDIWKHSWADWTETFKVNVMALYDLCGAFIPSMINNGFGRVINVSSKIQGMPEVAPYGASKWAVDKITDDIASKLEGTGVRINMLGPGWLRTDMGGENADHPVEAVLPGGLAPALVEDDGPNGHFFYAIDHNLDINLLNE